MYVVDDIEIHLCGQQKKLVEQTKDAHKTLKVRDQYVQAGIILQ